MLLCVKSSGLLSFSFIWLSIYPKYNCILLQYNLYSEIAWESREKQIPPASIPIIPFLTLQKHLNARLCLIYWIPDQCKTN